MGVGFYNSKSKIHVRMLGPERAAGIRFVCSDMWKAFLQVVKKKVPGAIHILDRFHIMALMNKAIDKIRAGVGNIRTLLNHAPPDNMSLDEVKALHAQALELNRAIASAG